MVRGQLAVYDSGMSDVTQILDQIERGNPCAAEQLLPLVYDELRRLAAQKMSQESPGQTLQATALVHEAYMRLVGTENHRSYRNRSHFFAVAATAIRRILVDAARAKLAKKRGGERQREALNDVAVPSSDEDEVLALDAALRKLAVVDPLKSQLVELRYFAGLTGDQAAEALGLSPSAADRQWAFARAWLQVEVRSQ